MEQNSKGGLDKSYKLIPFDKITDEAREMAVRWGENMKDDFIAQKHKLASDIMNYAIRYHESLTPVQSDVELQLCPKCNGQGIVAKPPYVPGDVHKWVSTSITFVCDVCNGAKVLHKEWQQSQQVSD